MEKKVFFKNKWENTLVGIFHVPKKKSTKGVVLVHGFTGNKDEHGLFTNAANRFNEEGFATLRFDFSGSGESEGIFNQDDTERWKDDLNSAIDFLAKQGVKRLALVGLSLGAYISVLCHSKRIKCITLWSPGYIEDVKDLLAPVLVVSGEDDPDRESSMETFRNAKVPNRYEIIPSSGHLFLEPLHQTQIINITLEWMKQWL